MRKIILFSMLIAVAMALCGASQAQALSWEKHVQYAGQGVNDTMGDNSAYGTVIPQFTTGADTWMRFVIPFDGSFCEGGAVRNFKLGIARGTALTISTHPQGTNSTWEFESQQYELNFRFFSDAGTISSWLEHPLLGSQNSTGGDADIAAGEMTWIEFHGQVNSIPGEGVLIVDVSRNASTNSGDNSTSSDPLLGLWWEQQVCN